MSPIPLSHVVDRLAILASGATLVLGCSVLDPVSDLPAGAVEFVPPTSYAGWWDKTQSCAGLTSSMENVTWYVVPGVRTFPTEAGDKVGFWSRSRVGTRIIFAGDYRDHELVVRHEILHELLGREGHPDEYFRDRCRLTWDTYPEPVVAIR